MITEVPQSNQTKYVVKLNGQIVSPPCTSRQMAESYVFRMSPDQQAIAEIIPMTSDGQQLLFG